MNTAATCPGQDLVRRFADDIVKLHGRLSFRQLPDAIVGDPLYLSEDFGDGLVTITFSDGQIPARYMKGVLGFRLAQYLKLAAKSPSLASNSRSSSIVCR